MTPRRSPANSARPERHRTEDPPHCLVSRLAPPPRLERGTLCLEGMCWTSDFAFIFRQNAERACDLPESVANRAEMKVRATGGRPTPRGKRQFRIVAFANPSGDTVHRVTGWTQAGERIRQNFSTHAAAVARLQELEIEAANLQSAARPVVTRLTGEQVAIAEAAFAQLGGRPLLEAVTFYLRNYREPVKPATVAEAFERFMAERRAANLRPASLLNLRNMNRELLTLHGKCRLGDILPDTLRPLVFKSSRTPTSADGYRRGIHAFFSWAVESGFLRDNPCASIRPVKIERGEPEVLTVDECRRLLEAAATFKAGRLVPYVALALFAGLRPTELARLDWSRVDLTERIVTVGADVAKLRGKRIVELSPNLVSWLEPFLATGAPIVGANHRKDFEEVRAAAGWGTPTKDAPQLREWTQDIMRHTAISMHLATYEHEGRTALWAGNSPDVVQRHYRGLVKKSSAAAFWSLSPNASPANLIPLTAAA